MTNTMRYPVLTAVLAVSACAFAAALAGTCNGAGHAAFQWLVQGLHEAGRQRHLQRAVPVWRPTGQLVTGVCLVELKGKINRKVFQITVPTGRLIPPASSMKIDDKTEARCHYAICFPHRCIAEVPSPTIWLPLLKNGHGHHAHLDQLPEQAQPDQGDAGRLHRRL